MEPLPRVVIAAFDHVQTLDVTGPAEVFRHAGRYEVEVVAASLEPVATYVGLGIAPARSFAEVTGPVDTLIVAGGLGVHAAVRDGALVDFVTRVAPDARRVASVCTGAFALAAAGLLDGRRATTHWASCERLRAEHPSVRVEEDPIYVFDGDVRTSAGVTAGMDLALALVEEDHGPQLALEIARMLVLYARRPGSQSQFSAPLSAQAAERAPSARRPARRRPCTSSGCAWIARGSSSRQPAPPSRRSPRAAASARLRRCAAPSPAAWA